MRLNAGIITDKLAATKDFYVNQLGFGVVWEADWFILLSTPNGGDTISFLVPDHPSQAIPHFQKAFKGDGVFFTIEVDNVDEHYQQLKDKGVVIELDIRDEPWGDRHFSVIDPNNIGVDFVTHSSQG